MNTFLSNNGTHTLAESGQHETEEHIGGGIGQSRTLMLLLRKGHLGEVSVTVWPKVLKEMCAKKNSVVLE